MSATTSGRLEIAPTAHVSIVIYNIKGQKVRNLVNGEYSTGHHSVVWDGTDDSGRSVGSGVYLYRMITDDFTATKKMILIK
jgi:flagellar hook assembly protein FlgD